MSEWTKGPWSAERARNGRAYGICARDANGLRLNIVNWGGLARPASDESQANARLIAAAPEMAELLERTAGKLARALQMLSTFDCTDHDALMLVDEAGQLLSRLSEPPMRPDLKEHDELERLRTIIREQTKFITGLTPGGSEFFNRYGDLYYADLAMCQSAIEARINGRIELAKRKLLKELEEARALLGEIAAEGSTLLGHVETATQARQDGFDDWLESVRAFLREGKEEG